MSYTKHLQNIVISHINEPLALQFATQRHVPNSRARSTVVSLFNNDYSLVGRQCSIRRWCRTSGCQCQSTIDQWQTTLFAVSQWRRAAVS